MGRASYLPNITISEMKEDRIQLTQRQHIRPVSTLLVLALVVAHLVEEIGCPSRRLSRVVPSKGEGGGSRGCG
jgi:hypothetical protein